MANPITLLDAGGYNPVSRGVRKVTGEANEQSAAIASGTVASSWADLEQTTKSVREVDTVESKMVTSKQYAKNLKDLTVDLTKLHMETKTLHEAALNFRNNLSSARSGSQDGSYSPESLTNVKTLATQYQSQLVMTLNTQSNSGVYLFGGSVTNEKPVGDFTNPVDVNVPDYAYYKGDDAAIWCLVGDDDISYNVRANDPAFEMYFRALRLAEAGKLDDAQTVMDGVIKGLNDLNLHINTVKHHAETLESQYGEDIVTLEVYLTNVTQTDMVAANTELLEKYTALQAMGIARMQYNRYIQDLLRKQ